MIYWAPLLHFYQPPTQLHWVLKKVYDECYRPLVQLLHDLPLATVTVNINAVLTEMLDEHGMSDVIYGLRELSEKDRLEFTGSAKYHAILPLVSEDEMLRQIVHNHQSNRRFFGDSYSPQGFFPPEMCYSRNMVKSVLDTGHRWMILSGIACPAPWSTTSVYEIPSEARTLSTLFRDDYLSNRVSFRQTDARSFVDTLKGLKRKGEDTYVVTAMDAETFGHHIRYWEKLFLAEVYQLIEADAANQRKTQNSDLAQNNSSNKSIVDQPGDPVQRHEQMLNSYDVADAGKIRVVTLSKLLEIMPSAGPVEPRASSWSTSIEDIGAGNPYPLWKSPENIVHQMQWQHLKLAIGLSQKASEIAENESSKLYADIARNLLDRALHSDQFWWASKRPWWDMNLVHRGLVEQREVVFNAYKAIKVSGLSEEEKQEYYYRVVASRDLHGKIMDQLLQD